MPISLEIQRLSWLHCHVSDWTLQAALAEPGVLSSGVKSLAWGP